MSMPYNNECLCILLALASLHVQHLCSNCVNLPFFSPVALSHWFLPFLSFLPLLSTLCLLPPSHWLHAFLSLLHARTKRWQRSLSVPGRPVLIPTASHSAISSKPLASPRYPQGVLWHTGIRCQRDGSFITIFHIWMLAIEPLASHLNALDKHKFLQTITGFYESSNRVCFGAETKPMRKSKKWNTNPINGRQTAVFPDQLVPSSQSPLQASDVDLVVC